MDENNQTDITWKFNIEEQPPFLQAAHCLNLIHNSIAFFEDIPKDYQVIRWTRIKITQNKHEKKHMAITLK